MDSIALAEQVKSGRVAADMTQAQLASFAGIPLSTLRKIEQGHTTDPRISTVTAILDAIRSFRDSHAPGIDFDIDLSGGAHEERTKMERTS